MLGTKHIVARIGLVALSIIAVIPAAYAEEHDTYRGALEALEAGRDVVAVANFERCSVVDGESSGPSIVGGFHITDFIVPDGRYIAFSNVHKTLSAQNQPMTEYLRYRVMPDGNAVVTMDVLAGGNEHLRTVIYTCKLDDGLRMAW